MPSLSLHSPFGPLTLFAFDGQIVALEWGTGAEDDPSPELLAAKTQLNEYFTGQRQSFDLPLAPAGTEFQRTIWRAMGDIPYGTTLTYGGLAEAIGKSKGSSQAVGSACAQNPIPILIPCHRVLPASGGLGNYSGGEGTETKQDLLRLEGAVLS
jgi:methylated-DNA-[protein]-cysteine S-methyltransferase